MSSDEYVSIVVDLGDQRGRALVRIWPSGQVDADYDGGKGWLPVSILGGSVRMEDHAGTTLAGIALHPDATDPGAFDEPPLRPFDQDVDARSLLDQQGEDALHHAVALGMIDADTAAAAIREHGRRFVEGAESGSVTRFVLGAVLLVATCLLVATAFPTGIGR